jgi:acyl-ACP thioesterase
MAITENKEIKIFGTFIQHESSFKFEFSINFQDIILNKHITNSNLFFHTN